MTRKLVPVLLAFGLLLPAPASSQGRAQRGAPSGSGAAQEEVFRRAFEEILRRHWNAYNDSTLWSNALAGLIESLNDPYASVFTPEEATRFDEDNTRNYSGIGVQISQLNDRVTITKVFRATPAEQAGLIEGDVIVGVEAHDATTWTTQTASDSIRGPAGTPIKITISRPGISVPMPFTITRAQVHVPAVTAGLVEGSRIGYIALDQVTRGSANEIDSVLRLMPQAQGLVIDLRRNPGGFLDESLMISDVFLSPGQKLASLETRAGGPTAPGTSSESWNDRNAPRLPGVPMIVLVDEYTASAAEIVTGALQDHDRALVIGRRTFGKGVVQTVLDLPYGHKLRLTTGAWHTPLGRSLQRARDPGGNPVAENPDTFPKKRTAGGRELIAGGGIFPDITIADDTLKTVERDLEAKSAEKEIPLALRIAEFGFQEAQRVRATPGAPVTLNPTAFQAFIERLRSEGVPSELLDDPINRSYLDWRSRTIMAARLSSPAPNGLDPAVGVQTRIRTERDPVLARAMSLLQGARTQDELYAAARRTAGTGSR
jgi:carboxyl-terminal processing protease